MITPMLAATSLANLDEIEYPVYVSPKFDGIRCIVKDGVAYSRTGKFIPNHHIQVMLRELPIGATYDGELMVDGGFSEVQSAVMSRERVPHFTYHVFDRVMNKPFEYRYLEVAFNLDLDADNVKVVDHKLVESKEEAVAIYNDYLAQGYEGMMVRSPDSPYKHGRSTIKEGYLLKVKEFKDSEAEVVGINWLVDKHGTVKEGVLGSLSVKKDDITFNIGSGFTQEQRESFDESVIGKYVTYQYQEIASKGSPRFPIFLHFREKE